MDILSIEGVLDRLDNRTLTSIMNCCSQTYKERLKFIRWLKFNIEKSLGLYQTRPEGWNFSHTLKLYVTNVTDVSMLGNVHTLDLSYTKVTDVSKLGKV